MGLFDVFAGQLLIEITSATVGDMLSAVAEYGITFQDVVCIDELRIQGRVIQKHFKALKKLLDRRGENIRVIRKKGLYWTCMCLIRRPVILLGLVFLAFLALFLPTRVFFVHVEGNITVPARQILDSAQVCGVRFGASRATVRSEQVKNALLAEIPQLKWLGVNTYGCVAVISVEEAQPPEE